MCSIPAAREVAEKSEIAGRIFCAGPGIPGTALLASATNKIRMKRLPSPADPDITLNGGPRRRFAATAVSQVKMAR